MTTGFLTGILFFWVGGKSIAMQISFVMLIFLLFSDQIAGRGQKFLGGTASGRAPPCGRKPDYQVKYFKYL